MHYIGKLVHATDFGQQGQIDTEAGDPFAQIQGITIGDGVAKTHNPKKANEARQANAAELVKRWNLCPELVAALQAVKTATLKQLAGTGKGKAPSPALQDAIDKADVVLAKATTPGDQP